MITFKQLLVLQRKKIPLFDVDGTLLTLDPGETTGYALWDMKEGTLLKSGQIRTWPEVEWLSFQSQFNNFLPTIVVFESYQVYEWKTEDHTWSQIPTVQTIGMLKFLCLQHSIPFYSQTAQIAKGFCSDEKLEQWGFWKKGERHARDAIRHGVYFLLFGPSKAS